MAGVKNYSGGIFVLLFFWAAASGVFAEDDVLFDDSFLEPETPPAAADSGAGDVPAAPPAQSAPDSQTPPEVIRPDTPAEVDLEPREIPETFPGQTEPVPAASEAGAAPPQTPPAPNPSEPSPSAPDPSAGPAPLPETLPEQTPPEQTPPAQEPQTGQNAPAEGELPPEELPAEETPAGDEIELVKFLVSPPEPVLKQLRGRPLSLSDLLAGTAQPAERQRLTEAYWELAESLALFHLSLIHAGDIEDCIARFTKEGTPSQGETAALVSARRLAAQRSAEAKAAFTETQCRFAETLRRTAAASAQETVRLAIPSDPPNTLPYKTKYDQIKREKKLSPQAAYLSEAIPARYGIMTLYDKAASDALDAYRTLYFAGGTSAETLLSAADKLDSAKEQLVRAAGEYNKLIAAYVAETVGSEVRGGRLISTMIRLPEKSPIPAWDAAVPERIAAAPIPTQYSPRRPRPVSAEIPHFDSSAAPDSRGIIRPGQNAEMLR